MGIEEIQKLAPWWHYIEFPDGTTTGKYMNPAIANIKWPLPLWKHIEEILPSDMSKMKILDIGANAGFFSVMCAERKATVVAIEPHELYFSQLTYVTSQFRGVTPLNITVYDIDKIYEKMNRDIGILGKFDIILFLGVIYHLMHPLLALQKICEILTPSGFIICESQLSKLSKPLKSLLGGHSKAKSLICEFISNLPGQEYDSNWFIPSEPCLLAWFNACGLEGERIAKPYEGKTRGIFKVKLVS